MNITEPFSSLADFGILGIQCLHRNGTVSLAIAGAQDPPGEGAEGEEGFEEGGFEEGFEEGWEETCNL